MSAAAFFRGTYDFAFQITPIILVDGLAKGVPGNMLPLLTLMGGALVSPSALSLSLNAFPWRFVPLSGASVISNAVGMYPFANQRVAANAIIEEPTNVSLKLIAPVQHTAGYLTKLPTFTALRESLAQHSTSGGYFIVATPSYLFQNCLLISLRDVTSGRQQQIEWQFDFLRPLISKSQAQQAKSSLMHKLANGNHIPQGSASWSGTGSAIGAVSPS